MTAFFTEKLGLRVEVNDIVKIFWWNCYMLLHPDEFFKVFRITAGLIDLLAKGLGKLDGSLGIAKVYMTARCRVKELFNKQWILGDPLHGLQQVRIQWKV